MERLSLRLVWQNQEDTCGLVAVHMGCHSQVLLASGLNQQAARWGACL